MDSLQRFVDAQDTTYRVAYQEMKMGRKKSHWIWFIFPQLRGLGKSAMSKLYGLTPEEAQNYLQHPILSLRLEHILHVLLSNGNKDIEDIMGSKIDAMKLQASMTLFDYFKPNDIYEGVLDVFFDGKRHGPTILMLQNNVQGK